MGVIYLTPIGKFLRKLRIDENEKLADMADRMDFTPAYLSAIETGKRDVPKQFIELVTECYSLSEFQIQDLEISCIKTQNSVTIKYPDTCKEKSFFVETAFQLKRKFALLNKVQLEKIRNVLLEVEND